MRSGLSFVVLHHLKGTAVHMVNGFVRTELAWLASATRKSSSAHDKQTTSIELSGWYDMDGLFPLGFSSDEMMAF